MEKIFLIIYKITIQSTPPDKKTINGSESDCIFFLIISIKIVFVFILFCSRIFIIIILNSIFKFNIIN